MPFPYIPQHDTSDCGAACLSMVASHYGAQQSLSVLRAWAEVDQSGSSMNGLVVAAQKMGFRTHTMALPFIATELQPQLSTIPLPAIVPWEDNHFVVVYDISTQFVRIADPAMGRRKLSTTDFNASWKGPADLGFVLMLDPVALKATFDEHPVSLLSLVTDFLKEYRPWLGPLMLGMVLIAGLQLVLPLLMQGVIDVGIGTASVSFVGLLLLGQVVIIVAQFLVQWWQNWILLHAGTAFQVSLLQHFQEHLLRLPFLKLQQRSMGDYLQRIEDHERLSYGISQTLLQTIMVAWQFLVFGAVLCWYHWPIFLVFLVGAVLFMGWIMYWLPQRASVDKGHFREIAAAQNKSMDMIQGALDIKAHAAYAAQLGGWRTVQARLFGWKQEGTKLQFWQEGGSLFIHQCNDVIITFMAASAVINGHITLGMMLAIQFIIGTLNVPLSMFSGLIRSIQDSQLSWERIRSTLTMAQEPSWDAAHNPFHKVTALELRQVGFRYHADRPAALSGVLATIRAGQVTAIVGASGGGKSTLLKIMAGMLTPTEGQLFIDGIPLSGNQWDAWRQKIGMVLQDSHIFEATIEENILLGRPYDRAHLAKAIEEAQLQDYVNDLPKGLQTLLLSGGSGLSQGQQQRLLLARALYGNASWLLLDEATNALDAKTEARIMEAIANWKAEGRTVVVVAHRLSTIKNADQVIVIEEGKMVECGPPAVLLARKGVYYSLVRAQIMQ